MAPRKKRRSRSRSALDSTPRSRRLCGVAIFLVVQLCIIWLDANGPFVDESLYTVAGIRVLEGYGLADGYLTWFNGSPFGWPVIAALGHHIAGIPGARLMAALLSTVTLVAFAKAADNLFGASVSDWSLFAFGVNGLFMALAHFAVYDVAAVTGLAVSMWCLTRVPRRDATIWVIAAAIAFAAAVIAKYAHAVMLVPLLGLLVSVRDVRHAGRALVVFLAVAGAILITYFWLFFGSVFPASAGTYFGQTFGRTRAHIAVLQIVFGLVPFALASVGALIVWRRGRRLLAVTCLLALLVYPAFHVGTANFVSGQKHVVAGFLFGYLLVGVPLERLWKSRSRAMTVSALAALIIWGAVQCYWQDHSWSDTRPLARHLTLTLQRGDRVIAESSWNYTLPLYSRGLIESPADVVDANHAPRDDRRDLCRIRWLVGNPDSAALIRDAVVRCGHEQVLSTTTGQYYFDTKRLWLGISPALIGLYRLPAP